MARHDTPRVSVIMPVYNGERFLEPALRSLLEQDIDSVEFTIVDDGSTDKSAQLIEDILAPSGKLNLVRKSNGGIVSALNAAIENSAGQYLARMDADDISRSDRLRLQAQYLDYHPNVVAVGSLCRIIDIDGIVLKKERVFRKTEETNLSDFPPRVVTLSHPSTMLRAETIKFIGGYRPYYRHAEDFDMFARIGRLGSVRVIQDHLLDYRIHDLSISSVHLSEQREAAFLALLDAVCENRGIIVDHEHAADRSHFENLLGQDEFKIFETYKYIRDLEDPRGRDGNMLKRAWRSVLLSPSALRRPGQSILLAIATAKLSARHFRYNLDQSRKDI